jgi:uncharacterized membrane protein
VIPQVSGQSSDPGSAVTRVSEPDACRKSGTAHCAKLRGMSMEPAAGDTRGAPTASDEERWIEAQSILDRTPTESAEQRIRGARRAAVLLPLALLLLLSACVVVGTVLLHDSTTAYETSDDVPRWQAVTGLVISGLAVLVMFAAFISMVRTNRRLRTWRSPLVALTRGQRKELLAQVRGRAPVRAERVPLARYTAELLTSRRPVLALNLAMVVMLLGQWITLRSWIQPAMAGFVALSTATFWLAFRRDERRAKRFLDTHPDPSAGSGA